MTSTSYYIQFIGFSLLVIGILLIILKFSKKFQKLNPMKEIKIIDRISTGSQSNIFILDIKNKTYIIGSTNHSITLIDKLS